MRMLRLDIHCASDILLDHCRNALLALDDESTLASCVTFAGPTHTQGDLPCYYSMTECVFSPDEKYVLTGLSGNQSRTDATVLLQYSVL